MLQFTIFPGLLNFINCYDGPPPYLLIQTAQIEKIWGENSPIRTVLADLSLHYVIKTHLEPQMRQSEANTYVPGI